MTNIYIILSLLLCLLQNKQIVHIIIISMKDQPAFTKGIYEYLINLHLQKKQRKCIAHQKEVFKHYFLYKYS